MSPLQNRCNSLVDRACTIFSQFVRLQNYLLFSFTYRSYDPAQFSLHNKVRKRLMTFLHSLSTMKFSDVPHGIVICVFHDLVKKSTIPQVELKQNALSDLRRIVNALGVLEDNGLKNDHPLSVQLPILDIVKFYRKDSHKYLPNFPRRCVIALGCHTNKFFHCACHLLSSAIPPSKLSP